MYIMKLTPVVKDYIWGGTRLREQFGIDFPCERTAEAWMLSCHPDGRTRVANGEHSGMTLPKVLTKHPEYMGTHAKNFNMFPLMIKLIDARESLSLQVHPDDEYAMLNDDDQGKDELWYVIDCDEDSEIICGFAEEMNQEEFKLAVESGAILDSVVHYNPKPGDVFYIEAGTVHAIGAGVLIAEIQQNSNATYRIYDYDRADEEGNKRPLHLNKAIDVTITVPSPVPQGAAGEPESIDQRTETLLGKCRCFSSRLVETGRTTHMTVGRESFASVVMIDGSARFISEDDDIELKKGDSAFIPAGFGELTVTGKSKFILTQI